MAHADEPFGVLLFDEGWEQLGEALKPYAHEGPVGKYLYCRRFDINGPLAELTFSPAHVPGQLAQEMTIWIPTSFIKFVASASRANEPFLGFV